MKFLLFVAIVVGLWLAIRGFPSKEGEAASLHHEGFLEVRATIEFGSTELEMVVIEEKPLLSDCEDSSRFSKVVDSCADEMRCEVTRMECKSTVDKRYLGMLDKRPIHLHYAHVDIAEENTSRSGVMVVWGLTVPDSKIWCRSITSDREAVARANSTWSCI